MAEHVHEALQTKLYSLLSSDSGAGGVNTLVSGRIYDFVPDNPTYPFVTMGDIETRDWGSHTHDGFEADATIRVWSQGAGRKEALQVMARVYELLHNINLSITDYPTITCREADRRVVRESDGETYQGIQRYRIILGGN